MRLSSFLLLLLFSSFLHSCLVGHLFYPKLGTKNLDLGCPYNPVINFGRVLCLSLNFPPNGIIKLILRVQYFPLDETTIRTKYLVSLDLMPCPTSVNLEAREICNVERTSEKHWQI